VLLAYCVCVCVYGCRSTTVKGNKRARIPSAHFFLLSSSRSVTCEFFHFVLCVCVCMCMCCALLTID